MLISIMWSEDLKLHNIAESNKTYSSFEEVDEDLYKSATRDFGYSKTAFQILLDDGTIYRGRIDLDMGFKGIGEHIKDYLSFCLSSKAKTYRWLTQHDIDQAKYLYAMLF